MRLLSPKGALPPDAASQARAERVVLARLDALAPRPIDLAAMRAEIDELLDPGL